MEEGVYVREATTGEILHSLSGRTPEKIRALATLSADRQINLYQLKGHDLVQQLTIPSIVSSIQFFGKDRRVAKTEKFALSNWMRFRNKYYRGLLSARLSRRVRAGEKPSRHVYNP